MADAKLTALTAAGALAAADLFYVSQSAASRKATGTQLLALVGTAYVPLAGGTMTGALTLPAGAVGAPALMFTGAGATTGLYSTGSNNISFAANGSRIWYSDTNGFNVPQLLNIDNGNAAARLTFGRTGTGDFFFQRSNNLRLGLYDATSPSTGPMTLDIYSYSTNNANYERLTLTGVAGTSVNITAETLGTGGDNIDIVLTPAGTGVVKIGALDSGVNFLRENVSGFGYGMGYYSSGIVLGKNGDPAMWIKQAEVRITSTVPVAWASSGWSGSIDTAFYRGAAGQVDVTNGTAGTYRDLKLRNLLNTEYHQMTEMAAPHAPATKSVRIYAEDNGSGKTRLMALFATGAAQQIAIEP